MCEKLPNQGFVRHMQVVFLIPGKMMVLNGELGPLMTLGTTSAMTIQLAGNAGGTKLDVGCGVAGYTKDGMNTGRKDISHRNSPDFCEPAGR
ncbi:MAG TPA: hypothetical protein VL285_15525 [Bryobacteraceae bacterium]|nr:hypothetical protein [Bryobacteraceae bacterium]